MKNDLQVSLITTVYNEAGNIESFLRSIFRQSRLPSELVIVDAGSRDETVATIRRVVAEHQLATTVVVAPGCNISQGRNIAIAKASHEVIAVTDAGTVVSDDWLELLIQPLAERPELDVVGGNYHPVLKNQLQRAVFYGFCWTRKVDPENFLPSSRSIAFRKEPWRQVGGYPEWLDYGEDTYFDLALKEKGARFYFQDRAVVQWEPRDTLRKTLLQYYRYGRGDGKAFQLFEGGYATFLNHLFIRLVLLLLAPRFPVLLVALTLHVLLYTLRYRVLRIFWNGEARRDQIAAALLSLVVSPLVETVMVLGYLAGLVIRKRKCLPPLDARP